MRFIHTADWHLGRILEQFHLTDDQDYVLDQLIALAKDRKIDAFLISGDVYDRGIPPPEAVELLSKFVSRMTLDLKIPIILIAGNHDSRERLDFGAKILERSHLHMFGAGTPIVPYVELSDAHGPVRFYALPYAEPAEWRQVLSNNTIRDHKAGFEHYIAGIRAEHPKGLRSVILAHCFSIGGQESDSERPLMLGGGGQIESTLFDMFDYTALGHLHRPQQIGKAWYSGSLLKYSKSEVNHEKSVNVVDMDKTGACVVDRIKLEPRRDLRVIDGLFENLMFGEASDDYIHVVLRDAHPILDAANRLRSRYPLLLGLSRPEIQVAGTRLEASAMAKMSEDQLFEAFFTEMSGEKPNAELMQVFREAAGAVRSSMMENPS